MYRETQGLESGSRMCLQPQSALEGTTHLRSLTHITAMAEMRFLEIPMGISQTAWETRWQPLGYVRQDKLLERHEAKSDGLDF